MIVNHNQKMRIIDEIGNITVILNEYQRTLDIFGSAFSREQMLERMDHLENSRRIKIKKFFDDSKEDKN